MSKNIQRKKEHEQVMSASDDENQRAVSPSIQRLC